ncbi:MAG: Nif3-like dinuclear metal center hexameric protein [Ruminococcus sp.]|nr:Nif3-like dinuclear metal center hexameric protein [Ruminococcus sp.]
MKKHICLGNRLSFIGEFITGNFADIGTDHGKLPVYKILSGQCNYAIAADINEKPLSKARLLSHEAGISEKILCCKSDGLIDVDVTPLSDIVISGMGGELILNILKASPEKISDKNLILQANSKWEILLDFLLENNFRIKAVRSVSDTGKTYTIINAEKESSQMKPTVKEIYSALDAISPFYNNLGNDNSGINTGNNDETPVTGILTTTDITNSVVDEAIKKGANVIISHHPVIWEPLKSLCPHSPAVRAVSNGITCIGFHLPFDVAEIGMNKLFCDKFAETFGVNIYGRRNLEPTGASVGYGVIFEIYAEILPEDFFPKLKTLFGTSVIRFTTGKAKTFKRIAFASGGCGDLTVKIAESGDADVFITGDCKHSHFIDAKNRNFCLVDCGHWGTEHMFSGAIVDILRGQFPELKIDIAETDIEPFEIVD